MEIISDPSAYLKLVKDNLENSWLQKEFEKIIKYYKTDKNTRVLGKIEDYANPLAFLLYRAEQNISSRKTTPNIPISNETVDATRLGLYLDILQNGNVIAFKEKFDELKNSDQENFEKIFSELNFAGSFVKSNHKVEFVKTQSDAQKRTPDLLVDDNIEVECKKKDKLTSRDRQNNDHWSRLERKTIELMNTFMRFYLIYAYFEKDPNSKMIKNILKELRKTIQRGTDNETTIDGVKIIANKICEKDELVPLGISTVSDLHNINPHTLDDAISKRISNPELVDYEKNLPDFDVTPFRTTVQKDGTVRTDQVMKFLFKAKNAPDRIQSIKNSIKNAKGQLSGDKIGIICVNITHVSEKLIDKDRELLGRMLRDVLRNNSRISAVAVTSEFYTRDKNGIRYRHHASVIRNENANRPLPENFVILN